MSLVSALYPALKPWLFKLDAEHAHEWTTRMMRFRHSLGMLKPDELPVSRTVECLGLKFPNALGLAAGMDKSASAVDASASRVNGECHPNGARAPPAVELPAPGVPGLACGLMIWLTGVLMSGRGHRRAAGAELVKNAGPCGYAPCHAIAS